MQPQKEGSMSIYRKYLLLVGFSLITSCKETDCTRVELEVECDQASQWSCNPGTRRCEQQCPVSNEDEVGIMDKGGVAQVPQTNSRCVGGWVRACADLQSVEESEDEQDQTSCYCNKHADCRSRLCNIYSSPGKIGVCEPVWMRKDQGYIRHIIYVDRDRCLPGGDGSQRSPYCEIWQATQRNIDDSYNHPIRVKSSTGVYDGRFVQDRLPSPVWIIGPDGTDDLARIAAPIAIEENSQETHFILEGLHIVNESTGDIGVRCIGRTKQQVLELRRVSVAPNKPPSGAVPGTAIFVKGCTVLIDRSAVFSNVGRALVLQAEMQNDVVKTSYKITNSVFANNALAVYEKGYDKQVDCSAAVCLAGEAGIFAFNTVSSNATASRLSEAGIRCGGSQRKITNSVVINNGSVMTNQFDSGGGCDASKVVVDRDESNLNAQNQDQIRKGTPSFVSPGAGPFKPEFLDLAKGDSVCRDQAGSDEKDLPSTVSWDYLGRQRPADKKDVGAFEAQ